MSNVIHANEKEFKELLDSGETLFVDFYASWCGPCKMLAPSIEKLADEHKEIKVIKIDTDEIPNVAMEYQVQSIPTLITFKNGQPVSRQMGFVPYETLENMIK